MFVTRPVLSASVWATSRGMNTLAAVSAAEEFDATVPTTSNFFFATRIVSPTAISSVVAYEESRTATFFPLSAEVSARPSATFVELSGPASEIFGSTPITEKLVTWKLAPPLPSAPPVGAGSVVVLATCTYAAPTTVDCVGF